MKATAYVPGVTGFVAGGKVDVAGKQVGTIVDAVKVDGGLEVTLELDEELVPWVRSTIPPGSISFAKEAPHDSQD